MRKKAKVQSKDKKNVKRPLFFIVAALFALILGGLYAMHYKQTVARIRNLQNDLQETQKELTRQKERVAFYSNQSWNCAYGGGDDAWFEKNAKTRTGQPTELLEMADEIGLKHIRKVNIEYIDKRDDEVIGLYHQGVGSHGENNSDLKDGRTLYVKRGASREETKIILAHEYLHYIWMNSATLQSDETLQESLMSTYANSRQLQERTVYYAKNGILSLTELFSYVCTEFSDKHLNQYIVGKCNQWVNRSKLSFSY